jgi:hypothetical protein
VILLYALPDHEVPLRVVQEFASEAACQEARDEQAGRPLPPDLQGRIVTWCELRA